MTHSLMKRGEHHPATRCEHNTMIFLLKGTLLVNSKEYAGVTMNENQFILQGIGSKLEMLAMTDVECLFYYFNKPVLVCENIYESAVLTANLPLIYTPLQIIPVLSDYLRGIVRFLQDKLKCKELIDIKEKELNIILSSYYSPRDLATLYQPISIYTSNFHYFVMKNYSRARTVEELAHMGGYSITTFRRIFRNMFNEPAYEWMLKKRSESIYDDLIENKLPIAEISTKYGFESLSHFSNFCKSNLGESPRAIRKESEDKKKRYIL